MSDSFKLRVRRKGLWLWRRARAKFPQLATLRRGVTSVTVRSAQSLLTARHGGSEVTGVDPANISWIFCVGRSGSTWLSNMMGELSGQTIWREPRVGQLFGQFYANTPERKRRSANFIMGSPTRKAWVSSIRNFVLVGARHAFPLLRPEHHLIIKEPGGGVGAPLLMEALPESRMILLVRDPRDVVASWLDATSEGGWKKRSNRRQKKRDRRDGAKPYAKRKASAGNRQGATVRKLAKTYLNNLESAKRAYEDHRGAKTLVLYEDLRGDTLGVMKGMYSDLGIEIDEAQLVRAVKMHAWEHIPEDMKGEGKKFRKASPRGWREDLTPEQAKMVERITAPVMTEFYS
jgi:Sulfotransferase domain